MKTLQNHLILMVVIGICISTILTGIVYLIGFGHNEMDRSVQIMELEEIYEANKLNEVMRDVEKLATALHDYYYQDMPTIEELKDPETLSEYTTDALNVAGSISHHNDLIGAVYYRFDPNVFGPTSGFFLSKDQEHDTFIVQNPTDLSLYAEDDREHVAWFYEPKKNGAAFWLEPYYNQNNQLQTITYAMPIYSKHGEFIGVVGMDIDFDKLCENVDKIEYSYTGFSTFCNQNGDQLYTTGKASISKDDAKRIIDNQNSLTTYTLEDTDYRAMSYQLLNGSYLILSVVEKELTAVGRRVELSIALITLFVLTILTCVFTGGIYRVFDKAQRDTLTGALNRDAYSSRITDIERKFSKAGASNGICVVVFDINGLKRINDEHGHTVGDDTIKEAYRVIREYFDEYEVFRIGGDEFVLISNNYETMVISKCLTKFKAEMEKRIHNYSKDENAVILSSGMAYLEREKHHCYEDVFSDADKKMYDEKEQFYQKFPELRR